MKILCELFHSSIGKKFFVAAAGLLLCGFLVAHLYGNLQMYAGEGAFNHYAETLEQNPLLPAAEIGLAALFLLHIAVSMTLKYQNRQARPVPYAMQEAKGGRTPGSRTMIISGITVLAFLIIHLKSFRFGEDPNGLFKLVMSSFKNPLYSGFYVLAMGALSLHLSHGFQSAFQTLGVNHPKYTPLIKKAGLAFALIICAGFASIPIWAYLAK